MNMVQYNDLILALKANDCSLCRKAASAISALLRQSSNDLAEMTRLRRMIEAITEDRR